MYRRFFFFKFDLSTYSIMKKLPRQLSKIPETRISGGFATVLFKTFLHRSKGVWIRCADLTRSKFYKANFGNLDSEGKRNSFLYECFSPIKFHKGWAKLMSKTKYSFNCIAGKRNYCKQSPGKWRCGYLPPFNKPRAFCFVFVISRPICYIPRRSC